MCQPTTVDKEPLKSISQSAFVEFPSFLPTHDKLLKIYLLHHHDIPQKQLHQYFHVGKITLNLFAILRVRGLPYSPQRPAPWYQDFQK